MSSALICGVVLILLALGYKFYGTYVEERIIQRDDSNETPAHTMRDGVDYEPTKPIILFGHHFSSIAGAGPIIGPIVGLAWFGWAATLGWIVIGSVFAGAVHDYLALMISSRQQGRSLADISEDLISRRAGIVFSIFLWAALVLVIAAFGVVGAKSLIAKPGMVLPTFMLIPIAMGFGWLVRATRTPVWVGTVLAVGLNFVFIYIGYKYLWLTVEPIAQGLLGDASEAAQVRIWFPILMGYCIVASLLPVWLLMQPRDYICVYKLFIGLSLGLAAVIIFGGAFQVEAFKGLIHPKGGPIWPMLFVVVACGAISGFHSVVAGGTTVKQLRHERDGKPIAFGGMILEGVLALLTVCLVGAGLVWLGPEVEDKLNAAWLLREGGPGPLVAFANGFGNLVGGRLLPFIGFGLASLFGMVMLKTFVLTSLDTCTRLARFVSHELVGEWTDSLAERKGLIVGAAIALVLISAVALLGGLAPEGSLVHNIATSNFWRLWLPILLVALVGAAYLENRVAFFRGRLIGTALTIGPAFCLGTSFTRIWPIFGAANQLIAALALIVAACYLLGTKRPSWLALVPAVFMLFTTVAALLFQAYGFLLPADPAGKPDYVLGIGAVVLALLGLYVAIEAVLAVPKLLKKAREMAEPEAASK